MRPESVNARYQAVRVAEGEELRVFGVVKHCIHSLRCDMPEVFGRIDRNNFYVSCERVFRPDLEGVP